VFQFRYSLALLVTLLPRPISAQDSLQAQILGAEDRRFVAMTRGDTIALRSLLSSDLAYTHTSGEKQDRATFLHALVSGELRYRSIEPTDRVVRILGPDAAAVVGRSNMQVEAAGQVRVFSIRYVAVYQRSGSEWQLVVWQSTRLPS
jgi:Domain of unknown function (DUF4440)